MKDHVKKAWACRRMKVQLHELVTSKLEKNMADQLHTLFPCASPSVDLDVLENGDHLF
jgi:hypothetical protein